MPSTSLHDQDSSSTPPSQGFVGKLMARLRSVCRRHARGPSPIAKDMPGPGERARREFAAKLPEYLQRIEAAIAAGEMQEAGDLILWFKAHEKPLTGSYWQENADQAKAAHFVHADDVARACANCHPYLIEKTVELQYLPWARRIQPYIRDRDVLDIGCGFGLYGNALLVAGAASYTGIDPQMPLDSTTVKNKRTRAKVDLGMSARDIMAACPAIKLIDCRYEELVGSDRFDTIVMHNVTEHLLGIRDILPDLKNLLHDGGLLIVNHHNFYCWNGHHFSPHQPELIDPESADHAQIIDWHHIIMASTVAQDHYFNRKLNQIRLDEFEQIMKDNFDLIIWDEIESPPSTVARLNDTTLTKLQAFDPTLTSRELLTNGVFCVAKIR